MTRMSSGVDHDGQHGVHARGELSEVKELHGARGAEGLLWVVQRVGHGVHLHLVFGGVEARASAIVATPRPW